MYNELTELKKAIESYSPISDETWHRFLNICNVVSFRKGDMYGRIGDVPHSFGFVCDGLMRAYVIDSEEREYNKLFFDEGSFPASIASLLKASPSKFAIQAIEDTVMVEIDFLGYRKLLIDADDLKMFHIHYTEKNWLLEKEAREVAMALKSPSQRYAAFLTSFPRLANRLGHSHIASHLGVSDEELERVLSH